MPSSHVGAAVGRRKGACPRCPRGTGPSQGRLGAREAGRQQLCTDPVVLLPLSWFFWVKPDIGAFLGAIVIPLFTLKPTDYPRKAVSAGEGRFRIKKSFRVFIWG